MLHRAFPAARRQQAEAWPRPRPAAVSGRPGGRGIIGGAIVDPVYLDHLRRRLVRDGLLAPDAVAADVGPAVHRLNQALRTTLGEYDPPPGQ